MIEYDDDGNEISLKNVRRKRLRDVYTGMLLVANISRRIDYAGISPATYYTHAHTISARIQHYLSWRNAKLLKARGVGLNKTIRVYTDVLVISLSRLGEGSRQKLLHVIASVIALARSYYILAVHPCFLPESLCPDNAAASNDMEEEYHWNREWDCLEHAHAIDQKLEGEEIIMNAPDSSRNGYFIETPYANLAHFLVVQKMLARFKKVVYYMDGDASLYKSALLALRDSITQERAEIVLFQYNKNANTYRAEDEYRPKEETVLKTQWKHMERRFNEKREAHLAAVYRDQQELDARIFKSAMRGGNSTKGAWAWLAWPPDNNIYRGCKTLWLTRRPNKTLEDIKEFLMESTLQPVDSAFASIRAGVNAAQRPLYRATGGPGYSHSYHEPGVVNDEIQVYLLLRNFTVRWRAEKKQADDGAREEVQPPARLLGLMTLKEKIIDPLHVVWNFRLGWEHAEVISKWIRR